jgi:hypothetical protein
MKKAEAKKYLLRFAQAVSADFAARRYGPGLRRLTLEVEAFDDECWLGAMETVDAVLVPAIRGRDAGTGSAKLARACDSRASDNESSNESLMTIQPYSQQISRGSPDPSKS